MNNQDQKPTITLAQWCAYLPYNLMLDINGKDYRLDMYDMPFVAVDINKAIDLNAKPLLRPMNRANEGAINEIAELLGYKFSSLFGFSLRDHSKHDDIHIPIDEMPYYIIQKLLAAHYDIFNLIPQGLALPIE